MQYLPTLEEIRNVNLMKIPCMRETMLYGLGSGIVAGVVWGFAKRTVGAPVGNAFFGTWIAVSTVNWVFCNRNERIRREAVQRMMMAQSRAPDMKELEAQRSADAAQAEQASTASTKT